MFKKCRICTHAGIDCIPYLISLPSANLLEWCRERKTVLHLSNAQIAEDTNIPKGTIDRLFSPRSTDFRYSTMQPVVFLLAGIQLEDLVCSADTPAGEEEHIEMIELLKRQVARERQIARTRLHIIQILAIGLAIALVLMILALATDFVDPDIGYFWHGAHN